MTTDTAETVTATLVRGRYHDAAGLIFDRDKPSTLTQVVSPEAEEYLREHAVDIEIHHEREYRYPRFSFSTDVVAPRPAPRREVRRRMTS